MINEIREAFPDEQILIADGYDDAIIGIETNTMCVVYSVSRCIEVLMNDMTLDEAIEFFEFKVRGSYVGDRTPIWVDDGF